MKVADKIPGHNPFALPDTHAQDRVLEPRKSRKYSRTAIAVLAGLVVSGGLVGVILSSRGAGASVERSRTTIATVERGNLVRDVVADGRVVAAFSPTLYAPAAGSVTLKVHAGDAVTKEQVVAVIDSPDLTARLAQEETTAEGLRVGWELARLDAKFRLDEKDEAYKLAAIDKQTAEREVNRTRKAYEAGAYPELQVLRAEDALQKAQSVYDHAKRLLESQPSDNRFDIDSKRSLLDRQRYLVVDLQRQRDALQIRAPVTGMVGQVQTEDRASVTRDTPLLTVVDLSALEVEIKMPESMARDVASGMTADLEGDARHWRGVVSAVSPQVVNGDVVARLRFSDRKLDGLRQSQRLSVRIFLDRRDNVLMVDRGSFVEQNGGGFVYVVKGNVAERRAVHLGVTSVQKVEVLEGLHEGDQIVVSGTEVFRNSERVVLAR